MDYFANYFSNTHRRAFSPSVLLNFNHLSPKVQNHLQNVYWTLTATLFAFSIGSLFHLYFHVGGILTHLGYLGSVIWLFRSPSFLQEKRFRILALAGFLQGCSLGTLIELAFNFHPESLVVAFFGTATVFACFSLASIYSQRRSYIFLGAILSSALSLLALFSFSSLLFGPSALSFFVEIYGGLIVFCGYVIYDTQLIIEKAEMGITDYVHDSYQLFLDFVAIFVRILIILIKNAANSEKKKKRNKRDD